MRALRDMAILGAILGALTIFLVMTLFWLCWPLGLLFVLVIIVAVKIDYDAARRHNKNKGGGN